MATREEAWEWQGVLFPRKRGFIHGFGWVLDSRFRGNESRSP